MSEQCTHCGNLVKSNDVFCTICGQRIHHTTQNTESNVSDSHIPSPQELQNQPLTLGKCVFGLLLLAIPVVNFICILVWAFSNHSNTNAKNMARALLIACALALAFCIFGMTQLILRFDHFTTTPPAVHIEQTVPWEHFPFDVSRL